MSADSNPADPDFPGPAPCDRGGHSQLPMTRMNMPAADSIGRQDNSRGKDCPSGISIREFGSYEDVLPYWVDLNRTYKAGELSLDWMAHKLIWDNFYRDRGAVLKIYTAFAGERCIGIFPMMWLDNDPLDPPRLTLSDDFFIAREYFCPPEKLPLIVDLLPPHFSDDMSCFYMPESVDGFSRSSGGVVELKESEDAYLQSLRKKARHTLKRTLAMNADLRVESDSCLRREEIQEILKYQLDYWVQKNGVISTAYAEYSRDKIAADLILMNRAEELGKLIAHYYYEGDTLLAANFSVRRDEDRVDDYLCLRDCREQHNWRGLGIFAILTNMNYCRSTGIRWYDLSACVKDYKKKFMNMDSFFFFKSYPEYPVNNDCENRECEDTGPALECLVNRNVQV
jgi:hypothetical protein